MNNRFARGISIVGHPLVTLPLAVCIAVGPHGLLQPATVALAALIVLTVVFIGWHVRRGAWHHVDANRLHERRRWNVFLASLLLGTSGWFAIDPATRVLALGFAAGLLPVLVAIVLSRWLKLSQHVAYCVYAALLLAAEGPVAMLIALLLGLPLAWSRVVLGRHTPLETAIGAASGMLAGGVFWLGVGLL